MWPRVVRSGVVAVSLMHIGHAGALRAVMRARAAAQDAEKWQVCSEGCPAGAREALAARLAPAGRLARGGSTPVGEMPVPRG